MIYFVTENYLKNNTPITGNVDITDVMPYVASQSRLRIKPILGSYFYDDILTKYNAQTLSADETTLVEFIQGSIAWFVAEDAFFGLTYQLKNKGAQQQFGDFSNAISKDELTFIMDHCHQKGETYEKELIDWLIKNKDLFPNFTSTDNKDSVVKPINDNCDEDTDSYNNTMLII